MQIISFPLVEISHQEAGGQPTNIREIFKQLLILDLSSEPSGIQTHAGIQ